MERNLQQFIAGTSISFRQYGAKHAKEQYNINKINEYIQMQEPMRIYPDEGSGFSEQTAFNISQDKFSSLKHIGLTVKKGTKRIRLDPCGSSCILQLEKVLLGRESISFSHNGTDIGNGWIFFSHSDPQTIFDVSEKEGTLEIDFTLIRDNGTGFVGTLNKKFNEWDEEKYKILKDLGLNIEVLWRKTLAEKGVTASWIRSCIATDQEWAHLVPKSVFSYLTSHKLDEQIKRLEQMRMAEKDATLL